MTKPPEARAFWVFASRKGRAASGVPGVMFMAGEARPAGRRCKGGVRRGADGCRMDLRGNGFSVRIAQRVPDPFFRL